MYYFNDYVFDPQRLLIYRENIDKDTIDKINSSYDYKHIIPTPYDLKMNPDKMQMDNIAIDRAGICLTYNCNLRCRYCGYSSNERSAYRLQLEDVEEFVRDIIMRRTIKVLITKKMSHWLLTSLEVVNLRMIGLYLKSLYALLKISAHKTIFQYH